MCGILYYQGNKLNQKQFKHASDSMNHRGPDYQGFLFHNDKMFAHNRLSIIDLNEKSNQPFILGKYTLIFNGEIYNYLELIKDHKLSPKTNSDTEIIILMYIKYGEKCLDYFNGMFAFVLYDKEKDNTFIARDRLGIKPLYIYRDSNELIVSSEIIAIKKLVDLKLSEFSLRQYRKFRMTINNDTYYENVSMFPAGNYLTNNTYHKYWELPIVKKDIPNEEELEYLIQDAVKLRMISDVPVSSYLSGGLDSTIITGISRPKSSWTIGFENSNEFEWSEMAGKHFGIKTNQIIVDFPEFLDTAKTLIQKREETLSVPNEVLIFLMTKKAREEGNKVILSGEGADELFWGYDRIFRWAKEQNKLTSKDFEKMYCYGNNEDKEIVEYALDLMPEGTCLEKIGHYFQITHLQGLLRRLDNSTMMCSVEGRVPFVDHRLVEFMNGRPFEYRMGKSFKEPLKRIYKNLLPSEIIDRPKIGFPVPLNNIFETKNLKEGWNAWFEFNLKNIKK